MKKISIILCLLILFSCNKDKEKDVITHEKIHGFVRNNCTGLAFPDVEVILTIQNENQISVQKSKSDSEGNFEFPNIEIHSSSKYKYFLSIDSYTDYSLDSNDFSEKNYEFYGIGKNELNKSEISNKYTIGVKATFKQMKILLPNNITLDLNDTVKLFFSQKTLHQLEPNLVYEFIRMAGPGTNGEIYPNMKYYVMGPWIINIQKYKNGLYSEVQDSIYMGKGETKEYIIPW